MVCFVNGVFVVVGILGKEKVKVFYYCGCVQLCFKDEDVVLESLGEV